MKIGKTNPQFEATNTARERLVEKLSGVAFGFGVNARDFVTVLDEYIDAKIAASMNRRY